MAATCKEVTNLIYMSVTYCFTWKKYSPIIEWEQDFKIVGHTEVKPKTCKLLVNSILVLANHCSYNGYFATTIEWE